MNENVITILSFVIFALVVIIAFLSYWIYKLKNNQEFDFTTKKMIMDELSKLHNQYQDLFNGLRLVMDKIDDVKLYSKLQNLNKKIARIESVVNNDYRMVIENDYQLREKEKEKIKEENNESEE